MAEAFEKTGPASALAAFEAEAAGLDELRAAGAVRVPEVYEVGLRGGAAFIAMERLRLEPASDAHARRFGRTLVVAELAEEYDFDDVDGTRPPSLRQTSRKKKPVENAP